MKTTAKKKRLILSWIAVIALIGAYVFLVSRVSIWEALLRSLFPGEKEVIYSRIPMIKLVRQHLLLVFVSSSLATAVGLSLGLFVTRPSGRDFLEVVNDLSSLGQTIPPVAVLALAVPFIGFGAEPTIVALLLYSVLPIVRNTIAGIESVSADVLEAARGMGMSRRQVLLRTELPLALPVIMAGIRISVVINIGTATIGAVVGSGGLGAPIVSGLVRDNPAMVFQGAAAAALLALIADRVLSLLQKSLYSSYAWETEEA